MSKEENHITKSPLESSIFNIVKVLRLKKCNSKEEGVLEDLRERTLDLRGPLNSHSNF